MIFQTELRAIQENYNILLFVTTLDQLKDQDDVLHFWKDWKGMEGLHSR